MTTAPAVAKTEPSRPTGSSGVPSPAPSASAAKAAVVAGGYQIQQNDTVQRFLDRYQQVGLDIAAVTAPEIALSIVAEFVAVRRNAASGAQAKAAA